MLQRLPNTANKNSPFGQETGNQFSLSSQIEFVPVEQAYQFNLKVEQQALVFDWTIRDGYYLYRDRFSFRSLDRQIRLEQPLFESGLVKWDEFFEQDLEVYYNTTSVRVPLLRTVVAYQPASSTWRSSPRAVPMPGSVIHLINSG